MTNITKLLPVGSVVRLNGAQKCLMIFGICQSHNDKDYDYIGVLWPEGNIGAEAQILFMHDDIQEVLFTGYATPERDAFISRLAGYYESKN